MRRFRTAQAPPPPEAPPAGLPPVGDPAGAPPPDMGGGMPPPPPPGGMPPSPPPPDPSGGAPAGARPQEIAGPLDSVSKIVYDSGAEDKVDNDPVTPDGGEEDNFVDNIVDKIAGDIWQQYGGVIDSQHMKYVADPDKTGTRTDKDAMADPDKQGKDRDATDTARYRRLPMGKTITDVCTYEELSQIIRGLVQGKLKPAAPPAGAPPPGMPPPMASSVIKLLRTATALDIRGEYHKSDDIDRLALRKALDLL